MPETGRALRVPTEKAVKSRAFEGAQVVCDRFGHCESSGLLADSLLQPGCGLPSGCTERHEREPVAGGKRLLVEQRENSSDGRRLAGPRATCDHGEVPCDGYDRRQPLKRICPAAEKPPDSVSQHIAVDLACGSIRTSEKIGRDLTLVGPVPVEVQGRPL